MNITIERAVSALGAIHDDISFIEKEFVPESTEQLKTKARLELASQYINSARDALKGVISQKEERK